jgi:imidazolonepropionase-like amidohydrolase
MAKRVVIRASELYDGSKKQNRKTIVVEGGRIVDVANSKARPDFEGVVTPALIDGHSHIGMFRAGEPGAESEGNEELKQILPESNPLHGVYYDDPTFAAAVDFGVLYSCIIPGSGNVFGGRAKVIRHFVSNVDKALVKDYGFKMALGYNPRSTTYWKGERPTTRMGVYGMIEKAFDAVLAKEARAKLTLERGLHDLEVKKRKKEIEKPDDSKFEKFLRQEYELALEKHEWLLLDALSGERPIKMHVHKEDDVIYLLELKKKYGLNITAEHCCDVHTKRIFNLLAKNDVPIVYGPIGSHAYKTELKHDHWRNVSELVASNANYGLMSDHPVIHVCYLRDSLKYFLYAGLSPAEAIGLITRKNAEILGLDDELGTVEAGKKASLVVWNTDPLHLSAMPKMVMGEGKVLRKN